MNELNIYKKFDYNKLLKISNLYFNNKYKWYNKKTVFAPEKGIYTVSISKYNVRICYWTDTSAEFEKDYLLIKKYLSEILDNQKTNIVCYGECNILDSFTFINKIQLR